MAEKFPYMHSSGMIEKVIKQLRRSFPEPFTANTLKKFGLVPKNESYAINLLRFLGLIDEEGRKVSDAAKAFLLHHDHEFAEAFQTLVEKSYKSLFDHHGDQAWTIDHGQLVTFFRQSSGSSDLVGGRQALTFETLARICERRERAAPRTQPSPRNAVRKKSAAPKLQAQARPKGTDRLEQQPQMGLTVRIEINLPAQGDKETYDTIFRSIRENLLGA